MEHLVTQWITAYGSLALFGLLVLGVFGAPVPDETLLVIAGALVGRHELGSVATYSAAFLGSAVGITLSYTVGRVVGLQVVTRFGQRFRITPARVEQAQRWFERTGKWALLFGYFVPGFRHLTAIIAGASKVSAPVFATFAYSGALLWSVSFITLGRYAGDRWQAVSGTLHRDVLIAVGVVLAAIVSILIAKRMAKFIRTGHRQ
jgi:membrane protein DedA with SNARE-associated domain